MGTGTVKHNEHKKQSARDFAIEAHASTNHYYDGDLVPYEFHLRLVVKTAKDFQDLATALCEAYYDKAKVHNLTVKDIIDGCWLHDTIEDVRVNYNDIMFLYNEDLHSENVNRNVAEIVRAVTNITRGRTRAERMSEEVYNDIRNTPGATFVKLCDRIANAQYSLMMGSNMLKKYRSENNEFLNKLDGFEFQRLTPMVEKLLKILNSND